MEHKWIYYESIKDIPGEKSYYCENCNRKIFTVIKNGSLKMFADDGPFEIISCEQQIIKNIIE